MESLLFKRKITASKQLIVDLPQLQAGDEVELLIMVNPLKPRKRIFDIVEWAKKWETDLGENVQSSDVNSFTGRSF